MKRLLLILATSALCFVPQVFCQKIITTIQIGGVTGYPAVNTTTNMIYVPNNTTGTVAVINGQTNQIVTNISVGTSPAYAAVNPTTNLIYVSGGQESPYLAVIDGFSNTVTATIPVTSGGPMAVNVVANLIYFLNGNGTISVLDGTTNQITNTITVAKSCCTQSVAYSSVTNRLYVPIAPHQLVVMDAGTYRFTTLQYAQIIDLNAVSVDSISSRVYLSDAGGTALYVVNGTTGKLITTILSGYGGPIAVNATNHLIGDFGFSLQTRSEFLAFVNGRSYGSVGSQVTFPPTTSAYTLVSGANNRYYVTFYQRDGVAVVAGPRMSGAPR